MTSTAAPRRLFVTAGNTYAPIDAVRGVTNLFTGRTGANIARAAAERGWQVRLATSHPELTTVADPHLVTLPYRTFDELHTIMEREIAVLRPDAVVHAAAVGDYRVAAAYSLASGATFDETARRFAGAGASFAEHERDGKISSANPELWLRMLPAPKLVDRIRRDWKFAGVLVKFKLEVGVALAELIRRGELARVASGADLLVANTFETAKESATILRAGATPESLPRDRLADRLMEVVESLLAARR